MFLTASTPKMFRTPADNQPLRSTKAMEYTRNLLRSIGENPPQFGTHSFRASAVPPPSLRAGAD
jgi:hypothetical protein